jgi:hypothetical protein
MPRPCLICSDSRKSGKAAELIAAGTSDQATATALNKLDPGAPPMSAMAVSRHRRAHVEAPARIMAEAAGKGREAVEQRAHVLAAAEAGDAAAAFISLAGIVADLRRVHDRLERQADGAEVDGQRGAVAALSQQQLRAAEVRSRLGGVGGYAPGKADGAGAAQAFSVNIHFASTGETISIAPVPGAPSAAMIDAEPDAEDE